MTFSELFEHIYSSSDGVSSRINALDTEDRIAWKIYALFDSRGGFDHWWGGIDEETQNEIFDELKDLLRREQNR